MRVPLSNYRRCKLLLDRLSLLPLLALLDLLDLPAMNVSLKVKRYT